MGRRTSGTGDSLELLLDTICNTFGGIVFLSLLVCLMSENSGRSVIDAGRADTLLESLHRRRAAEVHLDAVQRELTAIETNRMDQQKMVRSLRRSENPDAFRELVTLQLEGKSLKEQMRDATHKLEEIASETAVAEAQFRDVTARVGDHERKLVEATAELAQQRNKQTLQLRMPMAHATTKRQVAFLLSKHRLYQLHTYDGAGRPLHRNHLDISPDAATDRIEPADLLPMGGLAVDKSPATSRALAERLRPFSNKETHVAMAVWPDSYAEFQVIRDSLVSLGFDYELVLIEADGAVGLGSGGGGQVQ